MTKTADLTPEQIAEMRATLAAVDAREAAERKVKEDAAKAAVTQLVAGDTFKAALKEMEAVFVTSAPKNQQLGYAVSMMEQLRDTFATA